MEDQRAKAYIRTYGCQMNKHDSEKMAGILAASCRMELTDELDEADLIVFNTCCIRQHAENRLYSNVAALKSLKSQRPELIIAVAGCLAQRDGTELQEKLPHVDLVFGPDAIDKLPNLIRTYRKKGYCSPQTEFVSKPNLLQLPTKRENDYHAWLAITTGCNNFCSYCVVPYVRGREKSLPLESIVKEVERLAAEGVTEVTLLGQNVNSYGTDLYGVPQFANLLEKISNIKAIKRIRFTTSHPKDLTSEVIEVVAEKENVCPHFHLPVQSGSNKILKAMRRGYTREHYLDLIERIRSNIPDVSITTDVMVGFPGETEEDFCQTLDLLKKAEFDHAYTFIYSPRLGTKAAEMSNQVSNEAKSKRFRKLTEEVACLARKANQKMVGETYCVYVEGKSKKGENNLVGRTTTNKLIHFQGAEKLIGCYLSVVVKQAYSWFLIGNLKEKLC